MATKIEESRIIKIGIGLLNEEMKGLAFIVGNDEYAEVYREFGLEVFISDDQLDLFQMAEAVFQKLSVRFGGKKEQDKAGIIEYTKKYIPFFVQCNIEQMRSDLVSLFLEYGGTMVPNEKKEDKEGYAKQCLILAGIKPPIKMPEIPVHYESCYEGELIASDQAAFEFDARKAPVYEIVYTRSLGELTEDGVRILGKIPDPEVMNVSLGICIEAAGVRMQEDFEALMERSIHSWLNYFEGVMHSGRRDEVLVRIGKDAAGKGFGLKVLGDMLYYKMMTEYGSVVDRCLVTINLDLNECLNHLESQAKPHFHERDLRLSTKLDQDTDIFYTCAMCQSIAPTHCCIVTPEHPGICGAITWWDAKARKELESNGPCQPVSSNQEMIDAAVERLSQGSAAHVELKSMFADPHTCCGRVECICAYMPEAEGVIIVSHDYEGMTPLGMDFPELLYTAGAGIQSPGFLGTSAAYLNSTGFIKTEGGFHRVVWMPAGLKKKVKADFIDCICDETVSVTSEGVLAFIQEKNHPVLSLPPML